MFKKIAVTLVLLSALLFGALFTSEAHAAQTASSAVTEAAEEALKQKPAREPVKTVKVSKIRLTGISRMIAAGKKIKLKATVLPANASNKKLKWTSSNKKIATVTQTGLVKVKKKTGGRNRSLSHTELVRLQSIHVGFG